MAFARLGWLVLAGALAVAACGSTPGASQTQGADPDAIPVVVTTSVLADLVAQVGGSRVDVTSLVPKGGEVHTFDPTPAAVRRVAQARLIVRNGLGLDDWLDALVRDAGSTAPVTVLGEELDGVEYLRVGDGSGPVNPHLWMDVANASRYVDRITEALSSVDPADAVGFRARSTAYRATLADLDARIRDRLATLPASNRVVASFHDAFPYFAAAYGLTIVGTIVDAPGQDPSAGEIAGLVDKIRASGARAILAEAQFNDALARSIADETGATLVSDLYDDTLGGAPADTYVGMMTWDTDRLVAALGG
jgi:manganese/iron transport system substrate-binding protein